MSLLLPGESAAMALNRGAGMSGADCARCNGTKLMGDPDVSDHHGHDTPCPECCGPFVLVASSQLAGLVTEVSSKATTYQNVRRLHQALRHVPTVVVDWGPVAAVLRAALLWDEGNRYEAAGASLGDALDALPADVVKALEQSDA